MGDKVQKAAGDQSLGTILGDKIGNATSDKSLGSTLGKEAGQMLGGTSGNGGGGSYSNVYSSLASTAISSVGGTSGIFKGITSLLGGIFGFAEGGTVPSRVQNFLSGGSVGKTSSHAVLGSAVHQAMVKEGHGAVPIVAHAGEELASAKTGDAQLLRSLKASGSWTALKENRTHTVDSFDGGGTVGKTGSVASNVGKSFARSNQPTQVTQHYTTNVDVHTPDANSFRKSQTQINQEQSLSQQRDSRFNR